MSTLKEIVKRSSRRNLNGGESVDDTIGKSSNGYYDYNNVNPSKKVQARSTATPPVDANLKYFGMEVPKNIKSGNKSVKGQNYRYVTPSGHIIEYNDTPEQERILVKHNSGTGINMGPDGSVIVSSKERVDVISENHTLTVGNDGVLNYDGNLTLKVAGDFNVEVGGEYNVKSSKSNIITNGDFKHTTYGNFTNIIDGDKTESIDGINTQTTINESYIQSKGNYTLSSEGSFTFGSKNNIHFTSQSEIDISSPKINIGALKLNVIGDEGTIGGENIIMYNYNSYTGHTIYAEDNVKAPHGYFNRLSGVSAHYVTFHGDLNGVASGAISSNVAAAPGGGGNSGTFNGNGEEVPLDPKKTSEPNQGLLNSYLDKGSKGVLKVQIDPDDIYKQSIDFTEKNGNVSNRILNENEVRQQLRDPSNRENEKFLGQIFTNEIISTDFAKEIPQKVSYVNSSKNPVIKGQIPLGNIEPYKVSKKIKGE